jgi:CrcB protein
MPIWLAVMLGGATGSLARYALGLWLKAAVPAFPLTTLVVNVAGSFCIGAIHAATMGHAEVPDWLRIGLITGVLGGFTTFSAFSLETLILWQEDRMAAALVSVALNLFLALAACALGAWAFRSS